MLTLPSPIVVFGNSLTFDVNAFLISTAFLKAKVCVSIVPNFELYLFLVTGFSCKIIDSMLFNIVSSTFSVAKLVSLKTINIATSEVDK